MPTENENQNVNPEGDEKPSESNLPAFLRGKSESEISQIFMRMADVAETQSERVKRLESELRSVQEHVSRPAAPPPEPEEEIDLKDLIVDDPEKALKYFIEKNYGPQLGSIQQQLGSTILDNARMQYDGFNEMESDIVGELKKRGIPMNKQSLDDAYYLVLGRKTREEKERLRREAEATKESSPPPSSAPKPEDQLTDLDRDIMRASRITSVEEYLKFRDGEFNVKLAGARNGK